MVTRLRLLRALLIHSPVELHRNSPDCHEPYPEPRNEPLLSRSFQTPSFLIYYRPICSVATASAIPPEPAASRCAVALPRTDEELHVCRSSSRSSSPS